MNRFAISILLALFCACSSASLVAQPSSAANAGLKLPRIGKAKPRNIIFILTDDHRYDALGFLKGQSFLRTPHLDQMARQGVYMKNAFVTTALCSPSRASILTGLYAHQHGVVDNNNPVSPKLIFISQYLQKAGYETAMIGKWHMGGETDDPQRGFDHWVSFKAQGTYLPSKNGFNVDGKKVPQKGYITDELTDYALDWLKTRKGDKPFMLYLAHKGVHAEFEPAERHKGSFKNETFVEPLTMNPSNVNDAPMWARNQRNSWHGVDFPYHSNLNIADYYKRYAETLRAVDDSVGRIMAWLQEKGLLDGTLVIYMGDNGFAFGEHGLIDKRTAYEESMRVPMLVQCPELFKGGTTSEGVVANIDITPTLLEAAGLKTPGYLPGQSLIGAAQGKPAPGRDGLLYEYYWERNFPQTPTLHALRGSRYKYIHVHGLWDTDELYDLQNDPLETTNLIFSQEHQEIVRQMNQKLFDTLKQSEGMFIPLYADRGGSNRLRRKGGATNAVFPSQWIRDEGIKNPEHK
jgi:N-acetylglucosamine-6-sulfatase